MPKNVLTCLCRHGGGALWASLLLLSVACGGDVSGPMGTDSDGDAASDVDASIAMDASVPMPDAAVPLPDADIEEPEPPESHPCDPEGLLPRDIADAQTLGGFTVDATRHGLSVRHVDAGDRLLFDSVDGGFYFAETHLEGEDSQGSFTIDEGIVRTCDSAVLTGVSGSDTLVRFEGSLTDCGTAKFTVDVCEVVAGHLQMTVRSDDPAINMVGLRGASRPDERIYGMGEQFVHDSFNMKGRTIPVVAQEGGIGRGHFPISPAVNAYSSGSAGSEDSTYFPIPFFLTSDNRGFFIENEEYALFDFKDPERFDVRAHAQTLVARVLKGESPKELISRFTDYAGRMPAIPEWANKGAIVALARDLDESLQIVDDLQAKGAQIAAVWNQTWSGKAITSFGEQVLWNWVQNDTWHPGWNQWVDALKRRDVRTLCYVNSMLRDVPEESQPVRRNLYEESLAGEFFVRDSSGSPYLLPITAFEVGLLDFTNPMARDFTKQLLREEMIEKAGCSGWMADFAEALPFDAEMHDGTSGAAYHNRYPVEWAKLNREAVEEAGLLGEVLIFNRAGHTRTMRYSTMVWQGDQLTTWDKYDGLVSAIHGLLTGGLSGIALNHSDTGGYTSLAAVGLGYSREAELMKRWTEMNAFTSLLRTHEGNQPGENAQIYTDDEALEHFARFSKVYSALAFYRTQLFDEASQFGWPVVRPLMLEYPEDVEATEVTDQFLLGSEVLVAPIVNKCWTPGFCGYRKDVYFPAGRWVHLWTGDTFGSIEEGTRATVAAPIGQPAVFYREGSEVGAQFVSNLRKFGFKDVADAK